MAAALVCDAVAVLNTRNRSVRNLAVASGIVGALIVPFTYAFLVPVNQELFALDEGGKLTGADASSEHAQKADKLIKKWEGLHAVRLAMKAGAAALAICALLADTRTAYVATSETIIL